MTRGFRPATFLSVVAASVVAASVLACREITEEAPRVCTLIGCGDSLRVNLEPAVPLPYRAALSFRGGHTVAFRCTSGGIEDRSGEPGALLTCDTASIQLQCSDAGGFCSTSPVGVAVTAADGTTRGASLVPAYAVSRPNGPDCPPTCFSGVATLR